MKNILGFIPFVLLNLMAPDAGDGNGGAAGAGNDPDPAPETEPKPEGDTVEAKLTSALSIIKNQFARLGQLASQLNTSQSERAKLQGQFDQASQGWNSEKDAHKATKDQLGTANTTIAGLTTERDNANKNVERLESLCQLRGIDPKTVVPPSGGPSGDQTSQGKWDHYNELKDQEAKGKIAIGTAMAYWRENKAELKKFAAAQR